MKILSVKKKSLADAAGLSKGDDILEINGYPVHDEIDYMFYGAEECISMTVRRDGEFFFAEFDWHADYGIEFEPMDCMACGNNCIFCFVDQNPAGMRKTLYFKDEDYRFSFLHGSYVTLTVLKDRHLKRIEEQHLSPLYVSVHATDLSIRKQLLGITRDDRLTEKIDRLVNSGIILHCQVVVCPGINDGNALERTVEELSKRYPGIQSVAVVPVGLTKHRSDLYRLKPVDKGCAAETIDMIDRLRKDYRSHKDCGFVYCADEFYIRAGLEIPKKEYYEDFPQLENGVGMLRFFLDDTEYIENRLNESGFRTGSYVFVTGGSMSAYIDDLARRLSSVQNLSVRAVTVANRFFGHRVTVSGLLTGGDILDALAGIGQDEIVVLPPNCLNDDGIFLDDVSPDAITEKYGVDVIQGTYDPVDVLVSPHPASPTSGRGENDIDS